MSFTKSRLLLLGMAISLSACSSRDNSLLVPVEKEASAAPHAVSHEASIPESLLALSGDTTSDTFVGKKVHTFRSELEQLKSATRQRRDELKDVRKGIAKQSRLYHESIASISARLQVGSTPGNPVLHKQWNGARQRLDSVGANIATLNRLASHVSSDSAMGAYLVDSINAAYSLSGAVEEDHRRLRTLQDETNQVMIVFERLLSELSLDVTRQQNYLASERANLNTLALGVKNGQLYGISLGNRVAGQPATAAPVTLASAAPNMKTRRPLVVIRFDRQNVEYQQPLYRAVSRALERKPSATFDVVAVSPASGNPGRTALAATRIRRSAEKVLRSLSDMGLGSDRARLVTSASQDVANNEVQIFVR